MKKILLVVAALAALGASAESVTTDEAARAAANWLASGQAVGHAGTGGVAGVAAFAPSRSRMPKARRLGT